MAQAIIEHVNLTVTDPKHTAEVLCKIFEWKIRWSGPSQLGGETYHVGGEQSYVAVYSKGHCEKADVTMGTLRGGLNHVGVVVDDLDRVEERIKAAGFETSFLDDYEPGRRFYFLDHDEIEYEVVSYQ